MQIHWLVFFKQSNKQTDKPGQLCNLLDVWNSRNKKQLTITFCSYLQNQNVCLFWFLHAAQVAHREETRACSIWRPCYVFPSEVGMSKMCFLHELISASWQMFFYFCQTTPGLYSVMDWSPVQVYPTFWPVTAGMGSTPLWPWIRYMVK